MLKTRLFQVLSHSVWVAILGLGGCAELPSHTNIPDAIVTPPHQVLALEAMAAGVQVYECRGNGESPQKFQWVLKAPEAELYDAGGSRIARH